MSERIDAPPPALMHARGPVRRMNSLLIDRGLQLRYIAFVVLIAVAVAAVLGALIYQQERRASDVIDRDIAEMALTDASYSALGEQNAPLMASRDRALVIKMVAAGLGLAVVLALYVLFITHRFAGPLHKMGAYFEQIEAGQLPHLAPLRRGDWLQEFYDELSRAIEAERARREANHAVLQRALAALPAAVAQSPEGLAFAERVAAAARRDAPP